MNTNYRALIFGAAVAAVMTLTLDTVTAAESHTAPTARSTPVADVEVIRLDPVYVTAHKNAAE